jgi:hypothetical protein
VFTDKSGTTAEGLTRVVVSSSDGKFFRVAATGKNFNFSNANQPTIDMEIVVGDDTLLAKDVPCIDKGNTRTCRETPLK